MTQPSVPTDSDKRQAALNQNTYVYTLQCVPHSKLRGLTIRTQKRTLFTQFLHAHTHQHTHSEPQPDFLIKGRVAGET